MNVGGLGAVLYADVFMRVVVIWELGRTRDTGTDENQSPYQMTLLPLTPPCKLNPTMYSMFFNIIMHACIHSLNIFSIHYRRT